MKLLAYLLVVIAAGGLLSWEAWWRFDHPIPKITVRSPDGDYVAQVRTLTEQKVLPYGQAVFVRHNYIPLWATSKMVFVAYCKPDVTLAWRTSKQLAIGCIVAEGAVKQFPPPAGVIVVHDGGA